MNDLNQFISGLTVNHVVIDFYHKDGVDQNLLYSVSRACDGNCFVSTALTTIGFDENKTLFVDVLVYSDANATTNLFKHSYRKAVVASDLRQLFVNARRSFGCNTDVWLPCPWSTIASILLVILLMGVVIIKIGYVSGGGMGIITLLLLGFFAYIGWFYWVVYILAIIVLLLSLISRSVTS